MYRFIDVTDMQESEFLPSEALKINGEYIEDLIPGYQTLSVSGREALSPKVETYETGTRDGAALHYKRYPSRVITVKYLLKTASNEEFRESYNKLGKILDVTDAELIFADETDKFFTGTPSRIREVEPGRNTVVGEFEITCVDPFKYSVEEYEAEAISENNSILLEYNGTYKAYPTLEATFADEREVADDGATSKTITGDGDCGYVAFFTEDEKIIQLGDPDEEDAESYAKAQTLMNQSFKSASAWGKTASALWSPNTASLIPTGASQLGSVYMGAASYEYVNDETSMQILKARSDEYGDDETTNPIRLTYTVNAKTSYRTANSVRVDFVITAHLTASTGNIGTGREIEAQLFVDGSWRGKTMKKSSTVWAKGSKYSINMTTTVTGLSAEATSITGIRFKAVRKDSSGAAGELEETYCEDLKICPYVEPVVESYFLTPSSYGSASGKWHGPSITRNVPTDAAGDAGATNFTLTWAQKMCIGKEKNSKSEKGGFRVVLKATDGTNLAAARVYKSETGAACAKVVYYIEGEKVYGTKDRNISYTAGIFGNNRSKSKTATITKTGNKIVFNIGGIKKTFSRNSIKNKKVGSVSFFFERYSSATPLTFNGIYSVKFVKNNCDTWEDIPNKFSSNDVVEANCKNGEILLNGASAPELGALGNDWECFCLTPGLNQIGFSFSDWVKSGYEPTFKVRYREVFL